MPMFDFQCLDCKERFEAVVSSSEPLPVCPNCGGGNVQKELPLLGGYSIKGNNTASVSPKQAGSFKK